MPKNLESKRFHVIRCCCTHFFHSLVLFQNIAYCDARRSLVIFIFCHNGSLAAILDGVFRILFFLNKS
ncbi:hypothetical protein BDA99DRAFT_202337 [Phascolomyces articulosus]|uniref:Uncharacterized protein n=1 Tax=Phascolomyces articulosus TaxID=60185 RepID=A0AAD5K1W9_9FUNG|nr:hypothetical protein BDA99DRAFT_202337 [Phascolomyces articulosus]